MKELLPTHFAGKKCAGYESSNNLLPQYVMLMDMINEQLFKNYAYKQITG
jgi:hypothetical protein